jgi:hypothetical protein
VILQVLVNSRRPRRVVIHPALAHAATSSACALARFDLVVKGDAQVSCRTSLMSSVSFGPGGPRLRFARKGTPEVEELSGIGGFFNADPFYGVRDLGGSCGYLDLVMYPAQEHEVTVPGMDQAHRLQPLLDLHDPPLAEDRAGRL